MFSFGKSLKKKKKNFRYFILKINKDFGLEFLNDNTMNSKISGFNVSIPKEIPNPKNIKHLKSKNIYTAGRRYFGNWKRAIEFCDIDYERQVLKKVSVHSIKDILKDFADFDKQHNQKWIITDIRKKR